MLSLILGAITGLAGPISAVINNITALKVKQEETKSNIQKAKIDQEIQEAEGRKAILLAEAGHRISRTLNASMRFALAIGPASVLLKIYLWDKVIGAFKGCSVPGAIERVECITHRTDPLDTNLWMVITAVIAFYFAYDMVARFKK